MRMGLDNGIFKSISQVVANKNLIGTRINTDKKI